MKRLVILGFILIFTQTELANAEIILFDDFEDADGFTKEGYATGYWGLAPLSGTVSIPSYFTTGGSQSGGIFYGHLPKIFQT